MAEKKTTTKKRTKKAVEPEITEQVAETAEAPVEVKEVETDTLMINDTATFLKGIDLLVCKLEAVARSDKQKAVVKSLKNILPKYDNVRMYSTMAYCFEVLKSPQSPEIIYGSVINALKDTSQQPA